MNEDATSVQAIAIAAQKDVLAGADWYYDPTGGQYGLRFEGTDWHAGLDLYTNDGQRLGAPLYSAWYGTVVDVPQYNNEYGERGNYLLIKLDPGLYGEDTYILMEHIGAFKGDVAVTPGTRVSPGDLIGSVGNTGADNGRGHVHIEVMVGGITTTPKNPSNANGYYSIDPLNDPRSQALLNSYPSAW